MNLGLLISALSTYPHDADLRIAGPARLSPVSVESYRGYYEDLSITFREDASMKCGAFSEILRATVGTILTGYKGGDFRVHETTLVWVSNHGEASGCRLDGVYEDDGTVYLGVRMQWSKL